MPLGQGACHCGALALLACVFMHKGEPHQASVTTKPDSAGWTPKASSVASGLPLHPPNSLPPSYAPFYAPFASAPLSLTPLLRYLPPSYPPLFICPPIKRGEETGGFRFSWVFPLHTPLRSLRSRSRGARFKSPSSPPHETSPAPPYTTKIITQKP